MNVKVTLSLGRETEMCTVGMLMWAERAAGHVGALYANIQKSFQKHNLRPTCTEAIKHLSHESCQNSNKQQQTHALSKL